MTPSSHSRNATATIRGYMYQFDATILAILRLTANESLDVEGIEDFDIRCDDPTDLFQCKYYASQRLTPAELRDAILPMLKGFLGLSALTRQGRRFHLYGYYKDSSPGVSNPTLQELKAALVQRRHVQSSRGKAKIEHIDLQAELGASDADLQFFAERLTVHIGEAYETHKHRAMDELKTTMGVSAAVAREHLYPSALSLITRLATGHTVSERRTTRAQFCSQLMPSRTLMSSWMLLEMGDSAFCRDIRQRHFSRQNVDAAHRFFIVDCTRPTANTDLLQLLYVLRRKWSSHTVRRKPNPERYAPYVYLRGLTDDQLITIKSTLQNDGVGFVDGYAFAGAQFSAAHVATQQTFANGISLRILNCEADFNMTLASLSGTKCIYDFFLDTPLVLSTGTLYTAIPVNSIPMIERII